MRASLNEIEQIEKYLLSEKDENKVLLEAKLILEPDLREKIVWQRKTYEYVRNYGRKELKKEIEAVHQKLFFNTEHKTFQREIANIFSSLI